MASEFCIPLPPPTDMGPVAYTRVRAHMVTATARECPLGYFLCGVEHQEYQNWFRLVGKPFLFPKELREAQCKMWYCTDWAKV